MKVREIRDTLGLTQVELANKLHVSETAVSRWENDHCQPDRRSSLKLENLLKRHKMKESRCPTPA